MNSRSHKLGFGAIVSILLFCIVGCAHNPGSSGGTPSSPGTSSEKQQVIANAVEDTLSIGLVPVLANNQSYLAEAATVSAALSTISGDSISDAQINGIMAKTSMEPADAKIFAGLITAAWDRYTQRYAQQVSANIRPDVKLFLGAVARGIDNAVASVRKVAEYGPRAVSRYAALCQAAYSAHLWFDESA